MEKGKSELKTALLNYFGVNEAENTVQKRERMCLAAEAYMVCRLIKVSNLSSNDMTPSEISKSTGISELTVRNILKNTMKGDNECISK